MHWQCATMQHKHVQPVFNYGAMLGPWIWGELGLESHCKVIESVFFNECGIPAYLSLQIQQASSKYYTCSK